MSERLTTKEVLTFTPKGSIVPLVTPYDELDPLKIDREGLANLINFQIRGRTNGIFILGTTGEFRTLGINQKKEIIQIGVDTAQKRVPMVVGVSARNIDEIVALTRFSQDSGADGVVIAPLYGDGDTSEKFAAVCQTTELPIMLYNNPAIHDNLSLTPDFLDQFPKITNLVGIKDSSGDLGVFSSWLERKSPNFQIITGTYKCLAECKDKGVSGWVLAEANVYPEKFSMSNLMPDGINFDAAAVGGLREICGQGPDFVKIKRQIFEMGIIKSPLLFPEN